MPVKTHDKVIWVSKFNSNDFDFLSIIYIDKRWNILPQLQILSHTRSRKVPKDLALDLPGNTNEIAMNKAGSLWIKDVNHMVVQISQAC